MNSLYSRSYTTTTWREGQNRILSRVVFLDNLVEIIASLLVSTPDSTIVSAELTALRGLSTTGHNSYQCFSQLISASLYDNIGKTIDVATKNDLSGYHRSILFETFRGVMGSRGQFSKEAGFDTVEDFSNYWAEIYKGKCMFHSNHGRVERTYPEYFVHLGLNRRSDFLFSRTTDYHVYQYGGDLLCCGSLKDTFHQIDLVIRVEPKSRQIVDASGEIFRSPDIICRKACEAVGKLRGTILGPKKETIRDIRKLVASGDGCFHIGDMAEEMVLSLDLALGCIKYGES